MNQLFILCIDDQPEVLNALENDLQAFEEFVRVEVCDSGDEALALAGEIDQNGDYLAVVITDQVMPGMTGVDVLAEITQDQRFPFTQKILLTGLATQEDTIKAINTGGLDHYIAKPWTKEQLTEAVKKCLTTYVLNKGLEYEAYLPVLDAPSLYEGLRRLS
jgi:two-component system chemotaxis response regulator CheY